MSTPMITIPTVDQVDQQIGSKRRYPTPSTNNHDNSSSDSPSKKQAEEPQDSKVEPLQPLLRNSVKQEKVEGPVEDVSGIINGVQERILQLKTQYQLAATTREQEDIRKEIEDLKVKKSQVLVNSIKLQVWGDRTEATSAQELILERPPSLAISTLTQQLNDDFQDDLNEGKDIEEPDFFAFDLSNVAIQEKKAILSFPSSKLKDNFLEMCRKKPSVYGISQLYQGKKDMKFPVVIKGIKGMTIDIHKTDKIVTAIEKAAGAKPTRISYVNKLKEGLSLYVDLPTVQSYERIEMKGVTLPTLKEQGCFPVYQSQRAIGNFKAILQISPVNQEWPEKYSHHIFKRDILHIFNKDEIEFALLPHNYTDALQKAGYVAITKKGYRKVEALIGTTRIITHELTTKEEVPAEVRVEFTKISNAKDRFFLFKLKNSTNVIFPK